MQGSAAHYPVAMQTAAKNKTKIEESKKSKRPKSKSQNKLVENVTARPGHVARDDQVNPQSRHEHRGFGHVFSGMIKNATGYGAR